MKELKVEATIENLSKVFTFLKDALDTCDCPARTKRQIKLCVEEVFMNITHYAYNPETGTATIKFSVENGDKPPRAVISFEDSGKPYDPLKKEDPDVEADLDERPIGGLGIYLVKTTMDAVAYEHKDGQNVFTIEKEIGKIVG
ncbi:ATP-binding protein [Ruminococcus sp.]|uniref:ATP-binding protein n=1 Tax=Ruminococcus sp. TaxID=41978 RepID=UPI0025885095|nr:ATP-binding protein [Ruminococcus sp.]MCR5020630.1 ATP-binding protein [Ruminococcus sp.]